MTIFFLFLISFLASLIGSICGIGGGIIIKPVLDAFGVFSVSAVSFLSGCTVLAMSCCTMVRAKRSGTSCIHMDTEIPLAAGAAAGGVLGKSLFHIISGLSADENRAGAVQAVILLILTLGTLIYTLNKSRISSLHVRNRFSCLAIGLVLGILSSFLGIGGGPFNLAVLYFFFSMDSKEAAQNSLCIILFSQTANLITAAASRSIPAVPPLTLLIMICAGTAGGLAGGRINRKIDSLTVGRLFIFLMILIIGINIYNILKYMS